MKIKFIPLLLIYHLIVAFNCKAQLYPHEGYINVQGGKIWYRIVGSGNKTPLLLLHGGPGATSYYLNPLKELAKDRPVIFFDQLGCGRSTHITDTSLMTIDNFIDEIEQLKKALGITSYYLYGQSWGTMLGIDYYIKHPDGIKAIIFSSPVFSTQLYLKYADSLINLLPDSTKKAIRNGEKTGTYDAPDYQNAIQVFYNHFLKRTNNYAADMDSVEKTFGMNVYQYMWGPSEFTCTGTLKNFDRLQQLPNIKVPVLLIAGEYDEVAPASVRYYQSLVPNAEFVEIKNSGHLTMIDNTKDNNNAIEKFLEKMDNKK